MPEARWIDRGEQLEELVDTLAAYPALGLDTEFLRERTFFPRLCLLQIAAGAQVWCVDTLQGFALAPLERLLSAARARKIIHSARQDIEAYYVSTGHVLSGVFDTQVAAGCIGLKPQIGYAELVRTLLGIELPKGQTRTDWSKRPLSAAQLAYAADDVRYLEEIAARLTERLQALGREQWVLEECAALEDPRLYEIEPEQAWKRLKGARALSAAARARLKSLAAWRERRALERDLPRGWVLPDTALLDLAQRNPRDRKALGAIRSVPASIGEATASGLLEALEEVTVLPPEEDAAPGRDRPPSAEEKEALIRLAARLDTEAAALGVSPEVLATRAELKALVAGEREVGVLRGWRRGVIGLQLLEALG